MEGREVGACRIAPAVAGEVCEHEHTPPHTHAPASSIAAGLVADPGVKRASYFNAPQTPQAPYSGREGGCQHRALLRRGPLHTHMRAHTQAHTHTHGYTSLPRSAALSHPECRLPSSVCIFVTSPSSGPSPGRKLCLRWMIGVCSSLLSSSPDSREDELLPRTPGANPELAGLQQRWPHIPPWGSQGELVAMAPKGTLC